MINRSTVQSGCRPLRSRRSRFAGNLRNACGLTWISLLFIIGALLLFPERPAWGGEFNLESGPDGIRGYAKHASLEEVLGYLAHRDGYMVQIDQDLLNAPTTFSIPAAIPAERAIQRIVHPHSLALVFRRPAGSQRPVISQIKVFNKGSRSASFALLTGDRSGAVYASYSRQGSIRAGTAGGGRVRSGREAFEKHVQPPAVITKSSMGFTGFKIRENRAGPDYRPTPAAMAQAYTNYRAERNALDARTQVAKFNSAKQKIEQEKVHYQSGRTPALQKTINDSNN
jgi:hypothetical protein